VTKFFIENFGMRDLFGRENYEYYARLTGRILKVEDEYIFFTYPPAMLGQKSSSRDDISVLASGGRDDESGDGPDDRALVKTTGSLEHIPEACPLDPKGRLSISLDDQNVSSPSSCGSPAGVAGAGRGDDRSSLRAKTLGRRPSKRRAEGSEGATTTTTAIVNQAEVKSYTCLPQVSL